MVNRLGLFKRTFLILDRFNLFVLRSSLPITLSVESGVIYEQLDSTFRVNGSSWGLGCGINGDLRQVQIGEGSLDLMEAIIEAIGKATAELVKEGVGVSKLRFLVLLHPKDLLP